MAFGPKTGSAVADRFGLGSVFTMAWNIISVPIAVLFVITGVALVYVLAAVRRGAPTAKAPGQRAV